MVVPWLFDQHFHVVVVSVIDQTLTLFESLSTLLALERSTIVFRVSVFHNTFPVWVSEVAQVAACVELEAQFRNCCGECISTHLLFLLFFFLTKINFEVFCVDITHFHPAWKKSLLSSYLRLLIVVTEV